MLKELGIIIVLLLAGLNGCLGSNNNDDSVDSCDDFNPTPRASDDTLRILTYDIYALSDSVVEEFTNQTGYEIEFVRADDAGGILDQLMLTKSAPQVDLMIGLDNSYAGIALENCILDTNTVNRSSIDPLFASLDFGTEKTLVPFDHGYVCINYDSEFVDGVNVTVPTSLWNLTEEEWRGKVAFPSPTTSSPGRAFLLATIDYFPDDSEWEWWGEIAANDAIFTSGWTESYEIHYSGGYGKWYDGYVGDAHATISYCHSPGVEAYFGGNYTTSIALDLPRASFHQIEFAGVVNGAANIDAASAFIEYLISPSVNNNMPVNNYMYGVLSDSDLPETSGYRWHSTIPTQPASLEIATINVEEKVGLWKSAVE